MRSDHYHFPPVSTNVEQVLELGEFRIPGTTLLSSDPACDFQVGSRTICHQGRTVKGRPLILSQLFRAPNRFLFGGNASNGFRMKCVKHNRTGSLLVEKTFRRYYTGQISRYGLVNKFCSRRNKCHFVNEKEKRRKKRRAF